ncbi:MAG: glycogen synthase GlgA [Sphaerochaeta sp.]|jgi:starch synthase|nr:glycogen synthase GlgA [Sphaerochaeta sp.]
MNVLMLSSEAVPFCKSGGLADVVGALSPALHQLGADVRILLPLYGSIDTDGMRDAGVSCDIPVNGQTETVRFRTKTIKDVPYYFIDHPWFTQRKGIYGDTSFLPYEDNLERYTLLDKGALALCKALQWKPDVLHCHDWTTGFAPYLLKNSHDPFFVATKSFFTIHNLAYQGDFSRLDFLKTDIPSDPKLFLGMGRNARCNMLKAGLEFADRITTVSPTYAEEICTEPYGCGLDGLLRQRQTVLSGIINGIDYQDWNPETDSNLPAHFDANDLKGKTINKAAAQKEFGLPLAPDIPLVAMISRIADQKGFRELLDGSPCALERIVRDHHLQMVIIGTGDNQMEDKMVEIASRYPNLSVNILFSNRLAHLVEAGADYFLMPSRFEPCGLNQLYSLRYGTIPVARRTGGLADSIVDMGEHPDQGDGFLYTEQRGEEIEKALERALSFYGQLDKLRTRAMTRDFSWERSAHSYFALYEVS